MKIQLFLTFILAALLSSCGAPARLETSTRMEVVISVDSLSALRWHVPAGDQIEVQLDNQSGEAHTWSIHTPAGSRAVTEAWFTVEAPAGQTTTAHFIAPAAPGEYDVISVGAQSETRLTAEIVVVQP